MSRRSFRRSGPSVTTVNRGASRAPITAAAEADVRRMIADGDSKAAVERAKEIYNGDRTAVSEGLLVDAYCARIDALRARHLGQEADALHELVRRRHPFARQRLDAARPPPVAEGARSLDELVRPLADPMLDAAGRAGIERALLREVDDLGALARCDTLPSDHPLRTAAAALERALLAVTSGPVTDDTLALPGVSHRSPLSSWKSLVRAIACFHRGEDDECGRWLDAINPDSPTARLTPVIRSMIQGSAAATLAPAAAVLASRITRDAVNWQRALEALDRAFASGKRGPLLKAIASAVQECQCSAPGQIDILRQRISVRCAVANLDAAKVRTAMGGPSRHDAVFLRLYARGLEETRDPEQILMACRLWEEFRHVAAQEGWFAINGAEAAALALHIVDLLQQLPEGMLRELQLTAVAEGRADRDTWAFLFPDKLYARACALDPHEDAFARWMNWAARQPGDQAEPVARTWHQVRPRDTEPLFQLLAGAVTRGAFRSALGYLDKLERLDRLNPALRSARLRVLALGALRHLQQGKPALAAGEVVALAELPQAQHGDRPAFVAALRVVMAAVRGGREEAVASTADVQRVLGSRVAAAMLVDAVAAASKQSAIEPLGAADAGSDDERAAIPAAAARVAALGTDLQVPLTLSRSWMTKVARQFPDCRQTLDAGQLRTLGESALRAGDPRLAYALSAEGLARAGATEARFLLLRSLAVKERQLERHAICAVAAAALARQHEDLSVMEESAGLMRGLIEFNGFSLTLDQARDVLRREQAATRPPARIDDGPDYQDLFGAPCQCPRCRCRRGEPVDGLDVDAPWDDDDAASDDGWEEDAGGAIPQELEAIFMRMARQGMRGGRLPAGRRRKGKKR